MMEKPLFWHQGLFLQPQHLQLNDLHNGANFTPYHTYIHPCLHGIARFEIREASLSNYSFQIENGRFWFGDMTYAVLNDNAVMEPRLFKEAWAEGDKPLTVYIGLKRHSTSGENVTPRHPGDMLSGIHTRFVTDAAPDEINDMHQGGTPARVKKMNYLLKIFFHTEQEQLGDYELIPVARIVRHGEEISLSREFIPPCVSIKASAILHHKIKEICDQLSFRGGELELHKKKRGMHNAEFGSRDMVYLLSLRTFNRYIPVLLHMLGGQEIHPWDVYGVIRQLVGELSSFSEKMDVQGRNDHGLPPLPAYDHNNLWGCFSAAATLVSALLDEITAGPEYVVSLDFQDPYYSAVLNPEFFEGNNLYYLVVRTEEEVKKVLDAVEIEVKVGALKMLPVITERSLPGAALEYLPNPPQALPRRSDSIYFRVDSHCEQWGQIEKEKTIGFCWDDPPDDLSVEMMIVRRR